MKVKKINSRILILYIYFWVFLKLFSPFLSNKQLSNLNYLLILILIIASIMINRFRLRKEILYILFFSSIYIGINLILVDYEYFVLVETFSIFMSAFLPFYIITLDEIDYNFLLKFWFSISKILTIVLPIYIFLYINSYIGYSPMGHYSHLNSLIIFYFILKDKRIKIYKILMFLINLSVGLILGSRMLFVSSIFTCSIMFLFFYSKKGIFYYSSIISSFIFGLLLIYNNNILRLLYFLMDKLNIKSRNIRLFILQIENADLNIIFSGRLKIYKIVSEYIFNRFGFPGGLAVTRNITGGKYYFAHNIILDFFLVFGIIGTCIFLIWYIYKNLLVFKYKFYNQYKFSLYLILFTSFWSRAFLGTYFLTSEFFLISIALLITNLKYTYRKK